MKLIRTIELVIRNHAGNARIGEIVDQLNKLRFESGYLVPYISGSEDIEAILFNPEIIPENVPVEICGIKSATILARITALEEKLQTDEYGVTYLEFTRRNPLLMSFPPEIVWLGRKQGLEYWKKSLERFLPHSSTGIDKKDIKKVIGLFITAAEKTRENYDFWKVILANSYNKQRLSKILIEWSISMASRMRCRYMSGFNPMVDYKTPGSIVLNHRMNLAFATLANEMIDVGIEAPLFFYTIPLNSTMIKADQWTPELNEVVRNCRSALETTDLFGGIHVTIRNLELISKDPGRVRVVFKLIEELNKISIDYKLPVWYSRVGLVGLAALDEGADFASFTPNMSLNDVIMEPGPIEKDRQYGKIIHIDQKEFWDKSQVERSLKMGYYLPKLERVPIRNLPDSVELNTPQYYRKLFSKPYNIAAMTELSLRWRENIKDGEIRPGRHYLQDFSPPFNAWGL